MPSIARKESLYRALLLVALAAGAAATTASTTPDSPPTHFGYADDENDEPPLAAPPKDWSAIALIRSGGDYASENLYWIVPTFSVMLVIQIFYFFWAAGRLMKETIVSVRAVRLRGMPVAVAWKTMTDAAAFPDWRAEIASVVTNKEDDRETSSATTALVEQSANQLPAGWTETAVNGMARRWTVLEHDPAELVHVRAASPVLPFATRNPWLARLHATRSPKWTIEVRAPAAAVNAVDDATATPAAASASSRGGKKTKKAESAAPAAAATGCIVYLTEEMTVTSPSVRFALALWGYGGGPERCLTDLAKLVGENDVKIHRPVKGKLTVEGA
ncbi:hypothetical protein HDU86_000668 [Geranomyces michiganensis]|nr:hypothetical protein HDU86_000668 [Geranomyces michiganensis]